MCHVIQKFPIGVNEWRAGISKCRFLNIIGVNCVVPVTEIVLGVLGSLCCFHFFIWLSVFTALISAVVIWLLSHISSSALISTAYVLTHMNSTYANYLNFAFHLISNLPGSYTDKKQIKKMNYVAQNILYTILISSFLKYLLNGPCYPLKILLLLSGDIHTNPGPKVVLSIV